MGDSQDKEKVNIVLLRQEIDILEEEAEQFLRQVFGIEDALVTDLTTLSDFYGSGATPAMLEVDSEKEWAAAVRQRVYDVYRVEVDSMHDTLLSTLIKVFYSNHG